MGGDSSGFSEVRQGCPGPSKVGSLLESFSFGAPHCRAKEVFWRPISEADGGQAIGRHRGNAWCTSRYLRRQAQCEVRSQKIDGLTDIFRSLRESGVNLDQRLTPIKTAQGHDELSTRQRRLGPRHRTMLVLVNGVRTIQEVLQLSAQAGAPASCLDEMISMGLVVVPGAVPIRPSTGQDPSGGGSLSEKSLPDVESPSAPPTI